METSTDQILEELRKINLKLNVLQDSVRRIEQVAFGKFGNGGSKQNQFGTIYVINGCYTFNINSFPKEIHRIFTKRDNGSFYCNCKKSVFDDLIDLNNKCLENLSNLDRVVGLMLDNSVDKDFIINYVYNADCYRFKFKVKILEKTLFSIDNPKAINYMKPKPHINRVGDLYLINDDFGKYKESINLKMTRMKNCTMIQVDNVVLYLNNPS